MNNLRNSKLPARERLLFSSVCLRLGVAALAGMGFSQAQEGQGEASARAHISPVTLAGEKSTNSLQDLNVVNAFPALKFKNPIRIRHSGDGLDRLFVGTQVGEIVVFKNAYDVTETSRFLSIKAGHQLMDFAFHPDYSENGYVYTYYRSGGERAQHSVLSRFKVDGSDGGQVEPESEKVILEITRSFHPGSIQFGPDGFLYFVLGYEFYYPDKTPGETTDLEDNFSNLLGTMIRIDVDHEEEGRAYRIPDDNPFIGNERIPDQVWAYGFREPWRFCFDPKTGTCWLGDNGQWAYEEVNLIVPGGNYGWPFREGFLPFDKKHSRKNRGGMEKNAAFRFGEAPDAAAKFVDPVIEYPHRLGVCAVGGEFYYGEKFPELRGDYIYGDFQNGKIWSMRWDGTKVLRNQRIGRIYANITSFGKDEAGEIYLTAFDGNIYKFERAPESDSSKPSPK